ncbi:MAG TPA: hypothetical protein DCM87_18270 [Planctomycetes bacterium]|nr:hypothetical protein [Planctomycetota bacterium]
MLCHAAALLLASTATSASTFFYEDFATDPIAAGRMLFVDPVSRAQQATAGGEWSLTLPAGSPNFDTWCGFDRCPRLRIEAPAGDFAFEAKTTFVSSTVSYHAGLLVEFADADPSNFFMYGFYSGNVIKFEQCVGPKVGASVPGPPVTADLRIEKTGTLYTFSYRLAGSAEWIVTTSSYPWSGTVKYIGLFAKNWSDTTRVEMRYDEFLVTVPQPAPPDISGPGDGFAAVGREYSAALAVLPGYPDAGTARLLQGPPGMVFDPVGLAVYWTPGIQDLDAVYTVVVRAENSAGHDDASWDIRVLALPPLASVEAESGAVIPDMLVIADPDASGAAAVHIPPTAEDHLRNPEPEDGSASYEVSVPATADYHVWLRAKGTSPNSDSVWIEIDGGNPWTLALAAVAPPAYTWSRLTQIDGRPAPLPLSSGAHAVRISVREVDLSFDKLLLIADAAYVPRGVGPGDDGNTPPLARITTIPAATTLYLLGSACEIVLDGGLSWDDGVPDSLRFAWEQTGGPVAAALAPAAADTEQVRATFTATGTYTFRLTVFDGARQDAEEIAIAVAAPSPGIFRRGDANNDGRVNIGDAIRVLAALFGDAALSCPDAADANDDGRLDIADPITVLDYLFGSGAPLPAPGAASCNQDSTPDSLAPCVQESCS